MRPVEQVMYLDKVIIAHNLLQAIARVNRVGGRVKDKGFVVDYVGVGHHLKKAIDTYDEREQKEILATIGDSAEALRELDEAYRVIMALLQANGMQDLGDHDAFFDLFYDEDTAADNILLAFKRLTRALNAVYPHKEALDYEQDYAALTEVNVMAAKHFRDERMSMKGIPAKLRAITDVYLASRGIEQKVAPISILDSGFAKEVGKRKRTRTKAAAVEHAIRHHLNITVDEDPELAASFAKALEAIFAEFKGNWEKIYSELEKLRERIKSAQQEPTYGLHRKKQMPFFRASLAELGDAGDTPASYGGKQSAEDRIGQLVDLTQQVFNAIERELRSKGFWENTPAKNRLRAELQAFCWGSVLLAYPV